MPDLAFLQQLSAAARAITLGAPTPQADNKAAPGSFDPVTEIDRAAERALRAAIEQRFPAHGIEGEEYGIVRAEAAERWLLDPVDGTRALICGLASWTTLVAFTQAGRPTHGFIDCPRLDELFVGLPGEAMLNGATIRTSGYADLGAARLATTDPYLFDDAEADGFTRVRRTVRVTRYGLDAYAYARLAAGDLDLVVESGLKRHDWAALVPVVEGASGVVGNWQGGDDLDAGAVVAAASRPLFDQAIALLQE